MIRTGRSTRSCAAPRTPRTWAGSSPSSASGTSAPARPKPRAASSACGARCRIGSSPSCACGAITTPAAANAFLPAVHRRLQSPLRAPAHRSLPRVAPPPSRPRRSSLSCRYTRTRGPRQHGPPRPALAAAAPRPLAGAPYAGLPRRAPRVPRRPPGRPLRRPGPRRAILPGAGFRPRPPRRPRPRPHATPPRLQEPVRARGAAMSPWPDIARRGARSACRPRRRTSVVPTPPNTPGAARSLVASASVNTSVTAQGGVTFSRSRYGDIFMLQRHLTNHQPESRLRPDPARRRRSAWDRTSPHPLVSDIGHVSSPSGRRPRIRRTPNLISRPKASTA